MISQKFWEVENLDFPIFFCAFSEANVEACFGRLRKRSKTQRGPFSIGVSGLRASLGGRED